MLNWETLRIRNIFCNLYYHTKCLFIFQQKVGFQIRSDHLVTWTSQRKNDQTKHGDFESGINGNADVSKTGHQQIVVPNWERETGNRNGLDLLGLGSKIKAWNCFHFRVFQFKSSCAAWQTAHPQRTPFAFSTPWKKQIRLHWGFVFLEPLKKQKPPTPGEQNCLFSISMHFRHCSYKLSNPPQHILYFSLFFIKQTHWSHKPSVKRNGNGPIISANRTEA